MLKEINQKLQSLLDLTKKDWKEFLSSKEEFENRKKCDARWLRENRRIGGHGYTGNPEESQWCPVCQEFILPEILTHQLSTQYGEDPDEGYTIKCPTCGHLFDED